MVCVINGAPALTKIFIDDKSWLGANPLQVLKDNIPGYRLLREPGKALTPTSEP